MLSAREAGDHHCGANVVALDSGVGLSNATLQQRLVPVRLFYDYLIEEGLRDSNPVGRGRYTPAGSSAAAPTAGGDRRRTRSRRRRTHRRERPPGPAHRRPDTRRTHPAAYRLQPTVTLLPIVQATQRNIG